jgi:hypothetical protein
MFFLVWLGGPFLFGALIGSLVLRRRVRRYHLLGLGLLLALAFVAYAYLSAPVDIQHDPNGCSDCEQSLGRWWEPGWVVVLAAVGYVAWVVGLGTGVFLRTLLLLARKPEAT